MSLILAASSAYWVMVPKHSRGCCDASHCLCKMIRFLFTWYHPGVFDLPNASADHDRTELVSSHVERYGAQRVPGAEGDADGGRAAVRRGGVPAVARRGGVISGGMLLTALRGTCSTARAAPAGVRGGGGGNGGGGVHGVAPAAGAVGGSAARGGEVDSDALGAVAPTPLGALGCCRCCCSRSWLSSLSTCALSCSTHFLSARVSGSAVRLRLRLYWCSVTERYLLKRPGLDTSCRLRR